MKSIKLSLHGAVAAGAAALLAAAGAPALAQAAPPPPPTPPSAQANANCPPLLDHRVPRLQDEAPQHLCQYAGKVLLVVNTASYCGFTSQFEGLEALNAKYAPRGLVVLGFPSNDFKQEDADAKKTAEVCFNTYGVRFPMFATGPVRGADAQPLFRQLAAATGKQPSWNFNKYLVGRDGQPIAHFGSTTGPTSATMTAAVEKALAAR
ncbi:MAG: glutathione peroxidase [Rubrivivax sp.]|nr:glutathione peroxidase [Rubrivivax sp.]